MSSDERLPVYERSPDPPGMRLTERDKRIFEAIYSHEGILADYQIQRLFFSGRRTTQERLSRLYHNGYLDRPDRRQRATLQYMVYWLAEKGAAEVAALSGDDLSEFKYRANPRWSLVKHDVAVNDFRLDVEEAAYHNPTLELEEWIPSEEFWAYPDRIEYSLPDGRKTQRSIRPDGYFVVTRNDGVRFRMLLELDRTTEDNPRFGRDKVLPGLAYIVSSAYEQRFGGRAGRWLVVTTSERRMTNLMKQTERMAGKNAVVFWFTTIEAVYPETVLTEPIWQPAGMSEARALFDV